MNRRALIISNPGVVGEDNYSEGVNVDVKSYIHFLTSPIGGAWHISEIEHLDKTDEKKARSSLAVLNGYDYTMIIFTGHGYFANSAGSTILELRKNLDGTYEEIDSIELRKNAKKRTIILDCCRKEHPETVYKAILEDALAAKRELDARACRKYYDIQLSKCDDGIIVCYGCTKGEYSYDRETIGGFYSSSLIKSGESLMQTPAADLATSYYHMSVVKAHNKAVESVVELSGGLQHPDIVKPRSAQYFPFAIMA